MRRYHGAVDATTLNYFSFFKFATSADCRVLVVAEELEADPVGVARQDGHRDRERH